MSKSAPRRSASVSVSAFVSVFVILVAAAAAVGCAGTSPSSTARASEALSTPSSSTSQSASASIALTATSPLEEAVLQEINLLRADPRAYGAVLRSWSGRYDGAVLYAGAARAVRTVEGEAALDEAIAAVARADAAAATLQPTAALSSAAADHVRSQGATRAIGHRGDDGSNSLQRISRHGRSGGRSAEVIDYGWGDARSIVIDLLVDDGIADRGHRRALLDPRYRQAGVSCGPHARYGVMCVVELAERYEPFATSSGSVSSSVAAR